MFKYIIKKITVILNVDAATNLFFIRSMFWAYFRSTVNIIKCHFGYKCRAYDEISQVIDEDKPHIIYETVGELFVKPFCYTNDANNA